MFWLYSWVPRHTERPSSDSVLAVLYQVSKQLGNVLSLPISLHRSTLSTIGGNDVDSHRHDGAPPEVALVSVAIVGLKLVYGLDGKTR